MRAGSTIVGLGRYLPGRILTNAELARTVDTTDEWIRSRTGVEERRIAAPEEASSDLAYGAAREALETAGIGPAEIDLIVVGTTTPDMVFPNVACLLQKRLGTRTVGCLDVSAACSSFVYGLSVAVRALCDAAAQALREADLGPADVDFVIPHQANIRIIESAARRLRIPMEKFFVNVQRYGNTSAASIPVALYEAAAAGRVRDGGLGVLVTFGAGYTWGACTIRWGGGIRRRA